MAKKSKGPLTVSVDDRDLGYTAFITSMGKLAENGTAVVVGVVEDPEMSVIAAANEFGLGIPERSFLRSTADENKDKYGKLMATALSKIVMDKSKAERQLGLVGLVALADVQRKIVTLKDPPNSPATIKKKGSSNPLIDTGAMLKAQTFKVFT